VAFFDYNPDIIAGSKDALVNPRWDDPKGVLSRGFEFLDIPKEKDVDLSQVGKRRIIIREGDLSDRFAFPDNSVSAFESTLAIHHATPYTPDLYHVVDEVHRVLTPGGLFHWGAGIVNMRHQEAKIHRVASVLNQYGDVMVYDRRDFESARNDVVAKAYYRKGKDYDQVPLGQEGEHYYAVTISKEGGIVIQGGSNTKKLLQEAGFKQVHSVGDMTIIPLIDPGMQDDREQYLESVNHYYEEIISFNQGIFKDRPDVAAVVFQADNKEYSDAARGLFEYYTHPNIIAEVLEARGFRDITISPDSNGIWCNITARKE